MTNESANMIAFAVSMTLGVVVTILVEWLL